MSNAYGAVMALKAFSSSDQLPIQLRLDDSHAILGRDYNEDERAQGRRQSI